MEIITKNTKETQKIGRLLAQELKNFLGHGQGAVIVTLSGELGAGKTVFAQGFVAGLGIKEEISSPTFLIMKKIELHKHVLKNKKSVKMQFKNLYHFDCYRIKDEKDLADLDIKDIFQDKESIVLIEWAERIKRILPKNMIEIRLEYKGPKERRINFQWLGDKK